ncbi:MAG TPA: toxic anion resistance protein [Candidatus Limnocylindrales bacterium]
MSPLRKSTNPAEPQASPGSLSDAPDGAASASVIDPRAVERIESITAQYLESITTLPPSSPEFGRSVAAIGQLGARDFVATSAMSGRLLDRRFQAMRGLLATRAPLARQLSELRKTAARLDPVTIKSGGKRSNHDELVELDRYFDRFAKSQPRLEDLLSSLTEGRLALEQDNAAILTEQASLATEMETLRQYAFLAGRLDEDLAARIDAMVADAPERANSLRLDVLPVVRRRHQEILTQLAIVMQGYAALRIVEDNNGEVIRAIASAISTTTAALRTAVMVAGAAASQRIALGQLEAARRAVSTMSDHAAALEAGVSGPEGRVAMLREAWAEVYAALDRVDAQKAQVLRTISDADRELTHPRIGVGR